MPASLAPAPAVRAALVVAAAAALTSCGRDVTAPRAAGAAAPSYILGGGSVGNDSASVDPTPVPLQNGTASIPVTYTSPTLVPGDTVVFACDGVRATAVAGAGVATAACVVTAPGVYPVTATPSGGAPVTSPGYGVVYDPNGGFVTGGGWINSPAGAYGATPGLAARASFGFVAKYLPGRQTPDGETEFQFRAANFNFHGGVYQWLVVSGARAQYRGTGTVNNAGSYDFVVTATDGDLLAKGTPDAFRIKITDRASGAVVYDNQRGAAEAGDAATALASGSISIKK